MLRPSAPGLLAGTIALVMDGVYLALIAAEGDNEIGAVLPIAALIAVAGLAAVVGSLLSDPSVRAALLWLSALVLTGLGLLAIFTIGSPLLVAGLLAGVAAVRATVRAILHQDWMF